MEMRAGVKQRSKSVRNKWERKADLVESVDSGMNFWGVDYWKGRRGL